MTFYANNMDEVKRANKAAGGYWFSKDTMAFFASKIESDVIGGRYFISSEQYTSPDGEKGKRLYTVRMVRDNASIDTVSDFQQFGTRAEAVAFAQALAADNK